MSKIRVLSDHLANQIAAGEVVERPASVAKELVENSIDAGARSVEIDVEAGGRRLLRVADDGCGMTRDDALLSFERHATSKISKSEDLAAIGTLGFRGEALASIASVARVELVTLAAGDDTPTLVRIEGGRMRDVQPAARAVGTTITVRDLFFNVPARRKFLRSEATESFHLTNLVTHYALAHPEIAFTLTNNGREVLRCSTAADLRERAYQIFGAEFLDSLLEVAGGDERVARVRGYVSAPRERRTSRDAQYLFVNGRYVRDRLVSRALGEGYRTVLPHGVYPAALLFLEVPLEEVDVNVHPAKTEVRFRRASAVVDAVREAVRAALSAEGYVRRDAETPEEPPDFTRDARGEAFAREATTTARQESIEFGFDAPARDDDLLTTRGGDQERSYNREFARDAVPQSSAVEAVAKNAAASARGVEFESGAERASTPLEESRGAARAGSNALTRTPNACESSAPRLASVASGDESRAESRLPPLNSIAGGVVEVEAGAASANVRPLFQLEESYIVAVDEEGLLMIDQHAAHERVLFDKYRALENSRQPESQQLLVPETFDLTPAQVAAFDAVADDLEAYGFGLMRLSGRTVAVKAVPADLAPTEARNMLAEALDAVDAERRGAARATLRERVAASLACRAAIKVNTPLAPEKMRWLIDRLLVTSSPTTCPHGRPAILRLTTRDIERGFHRP
ncbi:MAG: DNA mismatch repair endonuclease MutL [Acidobacteria bacterium]|nr:DNA mismatch repair endonuclease MutL [Acidobacteriota bacterium]MCA1641715.1 DNA mismatch repair endonuclease MutL [Acidobacteriota bacterium]